MRISKRTWIYISNSKESELERKKLYIPVQDSLGYIT